MRSVRWRLLLMALLPLILMLPLLFGLAMLRWINQYDDLVIAKVASDLRVAEQYFGRIEETQAAEVAAVGKSLDFAEAVSGGDGAVSAFLDTKRAEIGLDFLILGSLSDPQMPETLREVALTATTDAPSAHLVLLSATVQKAISEPLAARAAIPLVPTQAARAIARDVESRGMFILAAYRLSDPDMVLLGGRLLNRNLDFIDTMNALVHRDETGAVSRAGTTTLFLEDVRISTNVRLFEGSRALGTRVSEAVWQKVMVTGQTWLNRAFVVNDWYISGYVPLTDVFGDRIGMLYTGFLEAPFIAQRNATVLALILAFVTVIGLSAPLFLWLARGIFAPLEMMTATMARAEAGALDARIGPVDENSEIGAVARHLDRLLDQVEERDASLRDYADNLNNLVAQRTQELQEANHKLEATFTQLVMAEKLASIGEITAGVAHEINNPVAVIQGNLEVVRMGLTPRQQDDMKIELDLIDAQTHRINVMVGKLLNFTRPDEMSDLIASLRADKAVRDSLILVAADLRAHKIDTVISHIPSPIFRAVETELQQVLVNLFTNAMQAMDMGGTLTIHTRPAARDSVSGAEIVVSDSGPGIPADTLDNVFDPFMTTKQGTGSGLGLSISQSLVTRVGGLISVKSMPGQGATFSVWFPAADNSPRVAAKDPT
ncbi:cache domain-containing protein [Roseovarius sp. LXJ103]|nr:cache domain-containing protein [Roseovarius carneus]PWE37361.1 two-component sensor histidine kinase [Pelagicola sp. LXJ1103]